MGWYWRKMDMFMPHGANTARWLKIKVFTIALALVLVGGMLSFILTANLSIPVLLVVGVLLTILGATMVYTSTKSTTPTKGSGKIYNWLMAK